MIRISTRTHAILDLVYSAAFLAAPFLLNELNAKDGNGSKRNNRRQKGIEDTLLPALGAGILAQGLLTNHEMGAVKAISMPQHLTMDLGVGAFMVAAPFLLDMDESLTVPMVALGASQIAVALLTETSSSYEQLENVLDDPDAFIEEISHII